jgi:hypothetical protein
VTRLQRQFPASRIESRNCARNEGAEYCLSALVPHCTAEWHYGGVAQIAAAKISHKRGKRVVALEQSRAARCRHKKVLLPMPVNALPGHATPIALPLGGNSEKRREQLGRKRRCSIAKKNAGGDVLGALNFSVVVGLFNTARLPGGAPN